MMAMMAASAAAITTLYAGYLVTTTLDKKDGWSNCAPCSKRSAICSSLFKIADANDNHDNGWF